MKTITVATVREDNGQRAFTAKELEYECYTPPGFDPSFAINPNDRLNISFYQPNDLITRNPLPFFQAETIERV
jgi:hypothetical protein